MTDDKELERLAEPSYWDTRYAETQPGKQLHEWFRSYGDLEPFLAHYLFQLYPAKSRPRILHLGSGDSTVPQDLAIQGYDNQLCVDFSAVVVKQMSERHANIKGIEWQQMDIRQMDEIPSESIDVAFDKGTLDAMIHGSPWSPPPDVVENTGRYMREVSRILKPTGALIYVTYRQPHFIRPLLNCEGTHWDIKTETLGASDSSFGYYGFICTSVDAGDAGEHVAAIEQSHTSDAADAVEATNVEAADGVEPVEAIKAIKTADDTEVSGTDSAIDVDVSDAPDVVNAVDAVVTVGVADAFNAAEDVDGVDTVKTSDFDVAGTTSTITEVSGASESRTSSSKASLTTSTDIEK